MFSHQKANLTNSSSCPDGAGNGVESTFWVAGRDGNWKLITQKNKQQQKNRKTKSGKNGVVRGRNIANQYSLTNRGRGGGGGVDTSRRKLCCCCCCSGCHKIRRIRCVFSLRADDQRCDPCCGTSGRTVGRMVPPPSPHTHHLDNEAVCRSTLPASSCAVLPPVTLKFPHGCFDNGKQH